MSSQGTSTTVYLNLTVLFLLFLSTPSLQSDERDAEENSNDSPSSGWEGGEGEFGPLADVAGEILKEQLAQNIGPALRGGDMLKLLGTFASMASAAAGNEGGESGGAGALLKGLGRLMGSNEGREGEGGGLNMELIGSLLQAFTQNGGEEGKKRKKKSTSSNQIDSDDFNLEDIGGMMGKFLGKSSGKIMNYLPVLIDTFKAFTGPEAQEREKQHKGHASLMPPILEKLHVYFDHFLHSDMGRNTISSIGAEKLYKVFLDDNDRFDYQKFGQLMENHSFRKHWISMFTDRIANVLHTYLDPAYYDVYLISFQQFLNAYLRSNNFPKTTLFDPERPVDSISTLIDFVAKKYFSLKIKSKEYVQPAYKLLLQFREVAQKPKALGSSTKELSEKLADTINLEIIEPLVRVNRAYRFATKVPMCDRYVFCVVNNMNQHGKADTLPSLKKLLYRISSLVATWFLSSNTDTSYWTLYSDITGDGSDCKSLYSDLCNNFHLEEMKVTTEYVHTEL